MSKIYRPGQIISIGKAKYRLVKADRFRSHCLECSLFWDYLDPRARMVQCAKYCYRRHNDFNKCWGGYVLKNIT